MTLVEQWHFRNFIASIPSFPFLPSPFLYFIHFSPSLQSSPFPDSPFLFPGPQCVGSGSITPGNSVSEARVWSGLLSAVHGADMIYDTRKLIDICQFSAARIETKKLISESEKKTMRTDESGLGVMGDRNEKELKKRNK